MFTPKRVAVALKIFDVISRADCEYVSSSLFPKIYDVSPKTVESTLLILKDAGILKAKRGFTGGYKMARTTNVLELFKLFAPNSLPDPLEFACNGNYIALMERILMDMKNCKIHPTKLAPIDFSLDNDNVETVRL